MKVKRGRLVATVAYIAVVALVGWLAYRELSAISDSFERYASHASEKYARHADEEIGQACLGLPARDQAQCIDQAEHTARQNQREEQDLAAQKVTAWWTKVMGLAALIGMFLSAIGVFLVWTTFHETRLGTRIARREYGRARVEARKAAEDGERALLIARRSAGAAQKQAEVAEDTARKQLRAYLGIDGPLLRTRLEDDGLDVFLTFKNFGQTPATSAVVDVVVSIALPGADLYSEEMASTPPGSVLPGNEMTYSVPIERFKGRDWHMVKNGLIMQGGMLLVRVKLTYFDIFGARWEAAWTLGSNGTRWTKNQIAIVEDFGEHRTE